MSAYYAPAPQRTAASRPASSMGDGEQIPLLDMQRSIYVFPNPSSAPSSPGGSVVSSIPSDYSGTLSGSSRPGTRDHSLSISSTDAPLRDRARGRSSATAAAQSQWRFVRSSPSGRASEGRTDTDVEIWDWMVESEGISDENATWEFEAEVERIGRWGIPPHSRDLDWSNQLAPHASSTSAHQTPTATLPYRFHPLHSNDGRFHDPSSRSRTQSNTSAATSSLTSAFSSFRLAPIQSPQPRVHIPLLSLIASLFSLDLDDPALRLLTSSNSTSESVLFPGHSTLLNIRAPRDESPGFPFNAESDGEAIDEEKVKSQPPHGLLRLLVLSDDSRISIRAMEDGLAVSCFTVLPTSATLLFPSFSSVWGFCRFGGGACLKGGKAWCELRQ